MLKLGVTGGIGCGKSTVTALLAELGATVIDADAISRSLTAAGGAALPEIVRQFGSEMLASNGELDRTRMRHQVFSDTAARHQLESIIHPMVRREIERQIQTAEQSAVKCLILDIPLLVESDHWRTFLDRILVVDCEPATQIQRTMSRNSMTAEQVQAIMNIQSTRAQRLALADAVVLNDGITKEELRRLVAQLAPRFGL
jgi:dephospho-CoA kinase